MAFAQHARDQLSDLGKQFVARHMPKRVIDFLEAIEIEQEQRRLRASPAAAGEHIVDLAMEHRAVGKTSKRIEICELFRLFFGYLALGNILDSACKADNPSGIIGHRPACDHNIGDEFRRHDRP